MENAFTDRAEADITGVVYNYLQNENSSQLYLKDVYIQIKDTEEIYRLENILVYIKEETVFKPGNRLQIKGNIFKLETPSNPGQFNQKEYLREKNIYYTANADSVVFSGNSESIYYKFLAYIMDIKEKFANVYKDALPEKECGVVTAMLLGDKTVMDIDIKNLYKQSGISHLLAISGLHISILGMTVYNFFKGIIVFLVILAGYIYKDQKNTLKYIKVTSVLAATARIIPVIFAVVFLFAYGLFAGSGISVQRAVIMMSFMLIAPLICRSYDTLSALCASAVIILLNRPFAVFSCSFLLSYGAVFGITIIYPVLKKAYTENGINGYLYNKYKKYMKRFNKFLKTRDKDGHMPVKKGKYLLMSLKYFLYFIYGQVTDLFLISLSVQIITLPVILYFYYEFPLYSIFINIIVIPLMPLIVITAAAGGLLGLLFMPAAKFLLGSTCFLLDIYEIICQMALKLPLNLVITGKPLAWQIAVYFIIMVFLLYLLCTEVKNIKPYIISLIITAAFYIIIYTKRQEGFSITFLDTGQGDAIFMQDNKGVTYLVDGGSSSIDKTGIYRIIPFLKYNGIRNIDYIIMTHSDKDHISGLQEIFLQSGEGIHISNFIVPCPAVTCMDKPYYDIINLAASQDISVNYIKTGDIISNNNGFSIKCLHPEAGFNADSANAYSTVLSITYENTSFLLAGDIEGNGEDALIEKLNTDKTLPASYNILKVAHHGSKNSSPANFLERVSPDISVISCGKNNIYKHPHKELTERLEKAGSRWITTKDAGAVTILSNGKETFIKTYNTK